MDANGSGLATTGQLRMSYLRWALVTVPVIVLLGSASGILSNSGYSNRWFTALDLPPAMPPGWVFGAVWTTLYVLMGLAVAMILNARGAPGRGPALALFVSQLALNLAWSPVFFGARQVTVGAWMIVLIFVLAVATTFAFARVRRVAAWLLVPYLAWLCIATTLAFQVDARNPDAETLVPPAASTQIGIGQGTP